MERKKDSFFIILGILLLISGFEHGVVAIALPMLMIVMNIFDFINHSKANLLRIIAIFILMNTTLIQLVVSENGNLIDYLISIPVFIFSLVLYTFEEIKRKK